MDLKNLFSKISFDNTSKEQAKKSEAPSHWIKCTSCSSLMFIKEIENQDNVCPKCGYHLRIGAKRRIEILADENTFAEFDTNLKPNDPLKFVDKLSYKKKVEDALAKTGRVSSVISGECTINSIPVQLVVFDFAFMGGSLGSVEGEKIVRAVNRAIEKREAVIIVSASGGARMQESTFALMQMAKTSAALKKLDDEKLPYISILTDPTFGGVSASFALLGDIIMAEPGALIGFAGQRVIKQTIGADLPENFQRAEFLLEKGSIDMVVNRRDMKKTISDLLSIFGQKKIS
ncbi:Acetyl-coenzyme A carboxylase carboxyl transferase subunit beta [Aliarcobacter thereius]|uniref:Acetyl-coenzyme A carboxylase carboxyl transferase subunit beta n=2 Tax=Aliarcobacter thereius TaxID=544718 RepID=A0A1C0B903_9BACT|nr:acetyl-CoA carboxylase, carboxyltransferase subunit beta [Aliarcobacter thereius]OCL88799.1 Acetyl-coenzyme A carboxylase carboxyl transferase subunit beta [Aliarcobacter thereius]OCL92294.1 Acetyl-coenzyme A carboxylase carboxyl transferase subunit beta [Aliarcobacter thereius]OCL94610.1 Acetyl-coenzyme A carboxylase carboxyl transferase subunit beta [Aliarcobacter thereius LMG 24486]OCM00048.1 Acetyl-coenzyme A carboxylase carboxyl transferase subunit beta [Aliarcobacter thereius]QBF15513